MFVHDFNLCFTVESETKDGMNVKPEKIRKALQKVLDSSNNSQIMQMIKLDSTNSRYGEDSE